MRDPAGYEAPYVGRRCAFNAADHPFLPLYGSVCLSVSRSPSLSRRGTIFRKGAKPRCRSGLPALICSSNIMASFRRRSCFRDPRETAAIPTPSLPPRGEGSGGGQHARPTDSPRLQDRQSGRLFSPGGQAIVNLFSLTSFVAAGLYFITRKIRSRG